MKSAYFFTTLLLGVLGALSARAALPEDARNARNATAPIHYTLAIENVAVDMQSAPNVTNAQCAVTGTVISVLRHDNFALAVGETINVTLDCVTPDYPAAPGAVAVDAQELGKARTLEIWGGGGSNNYNDTGYEIFDFSLGQ